MGGARQRSQGPEEPSPAKDFLSRRLANFEENRMKEAERKREYAMEL